MNWSAQQENIFSWFKDGAPMKNAIVRARAGTGKTTTIEHGIALAPEKKIAYLVFNKKNQIEAKEKIKDPRCKVYTGHALGYCFVKFIGGWKDVSPEKSAQLDRERIDASVPAAYRGRLPSAVNQEACKLMSYTKGVAPFANAQHILEIAKGRGFAVRRELAAEGYDQEFLANTVYRAMLLSKKKDKKKRISYDDMVWLPVVMGWTAPWYKLLVIDEAQDTNPTTLMLARKAVAKNGRIMVVGDNRQCLIEGTSISTTKEDVFLEDLKLQQDVKVGTGRGRLGISSVSEITKTPVTNCPVYRIETETGKTVVSTPEHLFFSSFLEKRSKHPAFSVYMMKRGEDYRIGMTKGLGYKTRCNQERADNVWILATCSTKTEALYLEHFYSIKYGIPTWIFSGKNERLSVTSNKDIEALYKNIPTSERAKELMKDLDLHEQYAHHIPKCSRRIRRNFNITICADPRGGSVLHRYSISGSSSEDEAALRENSLPVRKAKNCKGWRIEGACADLSYIYDLLNRIKKLFPVNIIEKANLSAGASLSFCPASHVRAGMAIFVEDDGVIKKDIVKSVKRDFYTGSVFDINLKKLHNYSANGIMTHNAIYGFRGADSNALDRLKEELDAEEFNLTTTYRCPKAVVALAKELVPDYQAADAAPDGAVNYVSIDQMIDKAEGGDVILSRLNAPLMTHCLTLLKMGKRAYIEGRDIGKTLRRIALSFAGKDHTISDFYSRLFYWEEQKIDFLKQSGAEDEAIEMVRDQSLVLQILAEGCMSVNELLVKLERLFKDTYDTNSDYIVLSSVHKAKGLEWNNTFLLQETFQKGGEQDNITYVAITRAKKELNWVA